MQTTLRKMGNSTGMILPKAVLDQLGLASGAKVEINSKRNEAFCSAIMVHVLQMVASGTRTGERLGPPDA